MEKEVIAAKIISGTFAEFNAICKQAQKEGWTLVGNPMMSGQVINQTVEKYK